ncbi:hypothetical protein JOF29_007107 [Kribbella aluminosa]|uniref:Uncharacterized protein n=1 Tax=Kribbella aluminosa TaxID=416017 RepID=A0ABS4UWJ4_9ACTN|nr:hypothetical protein [Kribbella aluminosa]MBP2355997.1 hypothetical protein [Kribbella aluminosa]
MAKLAPDPLESVALELARAEEKLPGPHDMPGGSCFELDWTGSFTEPCQPPVMRPRRLLPEPAPDGLLDLTEGVDDVLICFGVLGDAERLSDVAP